MLACVCQPTDPTIFRHSPIPLGTPPLSISHRGVLPKVPGRSIRVTPPIVDAPGCSRKKEDGLNEVINELSREVLLTSNQSTSNATSAPLEESEVSKIKNNDSSNSSALCPTESNLSFSPVKRKCTKKCKNKDKHKSTKKSVNSNSSSNKFSDQGENPSLIKKPVDCDKNSDIKSSDFDKRKPKLDVSNGYPCKKMQSNGSSMSSAQQGRTPTTAILQHSSTPGSGRTRPVIPTKDNPPPEMLPDGVQLTVGELREMACRQQAQIESQHQLLAAKEQRLRYLKEQEARQQRVHAEGERLRRLRDRVDAQELKLRKLRALRGQVDHQKHNNISLTSDLDSIRALFNEKEKELSLAVAKVEELTRQLEELRRGRSNRDPPPPSALELDKLRRELMYRNKLNEQQNQRLHQQREALTARQEEMSAIDKRISELQERLHRKRILNQQLANQISAASHKAAYHQLVRLTGNSEQNNQAFVRKQQQLNQPNGLSRGNIAAVEPYNHVPLQPTLQIKNVNSQQENSTYHTYYQQNHIKQDDPSPKTNNDSQELANKMTNLYIPKSEDTDALKDFTVSKNDPKYQTLPYNTKFTVNLVTNRLVKSDHINNVNNNNENNKEDLNTHISNNVNGNNYNMQSTHMTVHSAPLSIVNKNIATPLNQHDLLVRKASESRDSGSSNSNDIGSQKQSKDITHLTSSSSASSTTTSYHKPISSVAPTSIHHTGMLSNVYQTSSIKVQPVEPQTITSSKTPPSLSCNSQNIVQSPQSSILSPPQSSSTPLYSSPEVPDKTPKPALPPKPAIKPPPRQTQIINDECAPPPLPLTDPPEDKSVSIKNGAVNQKPGTFFPTALNNQNNCLNSEMIIKAKPLTLKKQPLCEQPKLRSANSNSKLNGLLANRRIEMPPTFHFPELQNLEKFPESPPDKDETDKASVVEDPDKEENKTFDGVVRRCKKGNLKQTGKSNLSRRVSFDPLALLLDASLEGELELVKKTATQVTNPSAANDEGITALHNAICAGHLEIVKFLVEFGCDVNAQDSDGWTPLHCAASCNNLTMVKFLVEHGACIFATTLSDHETAAEKCEEDEEGFDGCSEYLYSVQEKLGILSGGVVYAVFDYTAQQPDELSFNEGQQLTVLRKGDENEREWWWSRLGDKEGYIPRNLLGLYSRVTKNEE